jgi:hypothetical protein
MKKRRDDEGESSFSLRWREGDFIVAFKIPGNEDLDVMLEIRYIMITYTRRHVHC